MTAAEPPAFPVLLEREVLRACRRRPAVVAGMLGPDGDRRITGAGEVDRPDGGPCDGRTLFEIGSVTKVLTSLLLADAHLRGEVQLQTPLIELVPSGWRVPAYAGEPIRLWHLATHTAGLPRLPLRWGAVARLTLTGHPDPYAEVTEQDLADALARTTLRHRPGTGRLHYSNLGAGLLGNALARAAGVEDFEALLRARVTQPLGLHDTVVRLGPDQRSRLAQGHSARGRAVPPWSLPTLAGAGAVRSTAADLLGFLDAFRRDDHRLSEAMALTLEPRASGRTGLGWMLAPTRDGRLAWHNGGTGGYRSFVGYRTDGALGVVVLTNAARSVDATALRLIRGVATSPGMPEH